MLNQGFRIAGRLAFAVAVCISPAVLAQELPPPTSQYIPPNALEAFNNELLGVGAQANQPAQQQQEPLIYVKVGKKYFDAVEPHVLLHYDVNIIPLRISQFDDKVYFDDGINGGDEVPNDGMPSKIEVDSIHYMSVYTARNRDRIIAMKQQMVKEGPVKFFRLPAVTPDAYVAAGARTPEERREMEKFSASYWRDRISSKVEDIDNQELSRYEGYEVFYVTDGGQVFWDTTRPPQEVEDILDGRIKLREDALMRRDAQRDQISETRDQRAQAYSGRSPTDTYMRAALAASGAASQAQGALAQGMYGAEQQQPQQLNTEDRSSRRNRAGGRTRPQRPQRQPRAQRDRNTGYTYGAYSTGGF